MKKIRAVIMCASAMSSSLITESLKKVAAARNIDLSVDCFASLRFRSFDYGSVDIILMAPQVRAQLQDIKSFAASKGYPNLPFMLIPMREYGLVKGEAIMDLMLQELEKPRG